jgi:hypothetical protein
MQSVTEKPEKALSILITVVSGKAAVRRCLEALHCQAATTATEIIVPYDQWSADVGELIKDFPWVHFHFIEHLGMASSSHISSHQHRLYDRRRAVGLALAHGRIVAMTEDHAVPAENWCHQILVAHKQPYAVIGGAIDNGVDCPLNWALYYCDFGRYGRPLQSGETEYASDVNVTYKRCALEAVRDIWDEAYHETTVHWTLRSCGEVVFLDPRLVVHQHRHPITLWCAYWERVAWGRVFAETRVSACSMRRRMLYAAGTPLLPALLLIRVLHHMVRQRRTPIQIAKTFPLVVCLLIGWALGELIGYIVGPPRERSMRAGTKLGPER